jgi:hypothetical protein
MEERRELPHRGPGQNPGRQQFWSISGLKSDAGGTRNIIFWLPGSSQFLFFFFIKQFCDNECGSMVSASNWVPVGHT